MNFVDIRKVKGFFLNNCLDSGSRRSSIGHMIENAIQIRSLRIISFARTLQIELVRMQRKRTRMVDIIFFSPNHFDVV